MDIVALQGTLREFAAELLRLAEHASIRVHLCSEEKDGEERKDACADAGHEVVRIGGDAPLPKPAAELRSHL